MNRFGDSRGYSGATAAIAGYRQNGSSKNENSRLFYALLFAALQLIQKANRSFALLSIDLYFK